MSVIYFSDDQLKSIYENLCDIVGRADFIMDVSEEKLLQVFTRVGICNRLAYRYNYFKDGEKGINIEVPDFQSAESKDLSLKKLIEMIGLLEYNCVTNSGRCFLDSEDKQLFDKLVHNLRLRYIDVLEKNLRH